MANPALLQARRIVEAHLIATGHGEMASVVARGDGDDFPEIALALRAVSQSTDVIARMKRTLSAYADHDFWGEGDFHASLAFHDLGEFARETLAGKDPLGYTAG